METRANYALIGAFTLAVIASAFMFVFWFSGGEKVAGKKTYRIIFTGSVSGLSRGAQVLFNGLRVGEVTSLGLMDEDPSRVAATVDIDARTPVKTDTHAQLEFTGLTGIAAIALAGGGIATTALVAGPAGESPVIYANKSDIANLLANVQSLTTKADSILAKTDSLLGEGDGSIKQTLKNAEIFSKALADNAGGVGEFLASAGDIGRALKPLTSKLDTLTGDVDLLVKAIDPKRVAGIVEKIDTVLGDNGQNVSEILNNTNKFSKTLADNSPAVTEFIGNVAELGRSLKPLSAKIDGMTDNIGGIVKAIDSQKVADIIDKVDGIVGENAKALSETLHNAQVFSKALADSSQGITDFLNAMVDLSKQASPLATKLNGIADSAGALVNAVDPAAVKAIVGDTASLTRKLNTATDQASAVIAAVDAVRVKAIVDDGAELARKLNSATDAASALLAAVDSVQIKSVVSNAADLTKKLSGAGDTLTTLLAAVDGAQVKAIVGDTASLTRKLNTATDQASAVIAAVDAARVKAIVDDAAELTRKFNAASDTANAVLTALDAGQIKAIVGNTAELTKKLAVAGDSVNAVFGAINGAQVKTIVTDAASLAQKLNVAADSANAVIAAVDAAKIRGVVNDATEISSKLNASAGKIDTLIGSAQSLLGSPDTRGTLTDIADAARSIKKLADNLDIRTRDIATGITRFTGQGLRQYENLASDGRRTLDELNRTVRGLQKNPSQLIFGAKPTIPEYSGK